MSIIGKRFSILLPIFAGMLLLKSVAAAQEIEAVVKILSPDSVKVTGEVTGKNLIQTNFNWTFTNSIAGIENLGARISEFALADSQNRSISTKKLINGEYLANEKASVFSYQVNLKPLPNAAAMAHVSWLSGEHGLLMLADLLPQFAAVNQTKSAKIKFELLPGWKIISSEKNTGENTFHVKNIEKAIFLVGSGCREQNMPIASATINIAICGEWQFADAEALKLSNEIFEEYRKLFSESPTEKVQIFLLRFPKEIKFGRWAAETRGVNLTILSADMPFKTQSVQRLHEQLRHEIFHLWMPNNLALTGNYDWFYEGFTVYQALRTGVAMNQIRFEDYLDTLAEAYNLVNLQSNGRVSLVDSSKSRWSGENNQIYARGMLVAFLCDVAFLRETKGKGNVSVLFQEIYQKHRVPNQSENGNAAILKVLKSYTQLVPVVEKYITGTDEINWETDLGSVGIQSTEENFVVRLTVKSKLNGKQKDLLDKLGYNNWRKMSEKRK